MREAVGGGMTAGRFGKMSLNVQSRIYIKERQMKKLKDGLWHDSPEDIERCLNCPRLTCEKGACQWMRDPSGAVVKTVREPTPWERYFHESETPVGKLNLALGKNHDYVSMLWKRKTKTYNRAELEAIEEAAWLIGGTAVADGMARVLQEAGFVEVKNCWGGRRTVKRKEASEEEKAAARLRAEGRERLREETASRAAAEPKKKPRLCGVVLTPWAEYFREAGVTMCDVSKLLGMSRKYVEMIYRRSSKVYEWAELEDIEQAANGWEVKAVELEGILQDAGFTEGKVRNGRKRC